MGEPSGRRRRAGLLRGAVVAELLPGVVGKRRHLPAGDDRQQLRLRGRVGGAVPQCKMGRRSHGPPASELFLDGRPLLDERAQGLRMIKMVARAFTLIELLVVVTIIVVLLALLTPALDKAVESAVKTKCAAQHHSLLQICSQYALNDGRRRYPTGRRDLGASSRNNWYEQTMWVSQSFLDLIVSYTGNNKSVRSSSTQPYDSWSGSDELAAGVSEVRYGTI